MTSFIPNVTSQAGGRRYGPGDLAACSEKGLLTAWVCSYGRGLATIEGRTIVEGPCAGK